MRCVGVTYIPGLFGAVGRGVSLNAGPTPCLESSRCAGAMASLAESIVAGTANETDETDEACFLGECVCAEGTVVRSRDVLRFIRTFAELSLFVLVSSSGRVA